MRAVPVLLLPVPAFAQSGLPDGPGKAAVEKLCSGCHNFIVITQNRGDKSHREGVVENMVSRGAEGTDDEIEQVVQYLSAHFGPLPKINVNKAAAEELAKALDISSESAGAIVQYRAKNGDFKNLDQLKQIPGLDAKKIDRNKDRIEFQ